MRQLVWVAGDNLGVCAFLSAALIGFMLYLAVHRRR